MDKLIRIYNQNRAVIIAVIVVIALIIILIQTLNSLVKEEQETKRQSIANEENSSTSQSTTILGKDTSSITGEKDVNNKQNTDIIKLFVKHCNEGKVEEAYNMLTDECKAQVYPSLERFKTLYYDRIFKINRMYTLENWYVSGNLATYYIKYTEDVLASGNVNSMDNRGDYITVTRLENTNCLNISSYVGSKNINKFQTKNGVTIEIEKMYMYMDYTILSLKVKNTNKDIISIDTKESLDTMYLYDTNGVRYSSFLNENAEEELTFRRNMEMTVEIKFNKMYNPTSREISGLALKDVVLNYENYKAKGEEKNKITFDIDI